MICDTRMRWPTAYCGKACGKRVTMASTGVAAAGVPSMAASSPVAADHELVVVEVGVSIVPVAADRQPHELVPRTAEVRPLPVEVGARGDERRPAVDRRRARNEESGSRAGPDGARREGHGDHGHRGVGDGAEQAGGHRGQGCEEDGGLGGGGGDDDGVGLEHSARRLRRCRGRPCPQASVLTMQGEGEAGGPRPVPVPRSTASTRTPRRIPTPRPTSASARWSARLAAPDVSERKVGVDGSAAGWARRSRRMKLPGC